MRGRVFRNNYKGHMVKTKGGWKQEREVGLAGVSGGSCGLMQILTSRILCCGSNRQIHTDCRNPVEKKGRHGHFLSERG